jgi:hypothetical protein
MERKRLVANCMNVNKQRRERVMSTDHVDNLRVYGLSDYATLFCDVLQHLV